MCLKNNVCNEKREKKIKCDWVRVFMSKKKSENFVFLKLIVKKEMIQQLK
jgi:hypothetical protein